MPSLCVSSVLSDCASEFGNLDMSDFGAEYNLNPVLNPTKASPCDTTDIACEDSFMIDVHVD